MGWSWWSSRWKWAYWQRDTDKVPEYVLTLMLYDLLSHLCSNCNTFFCFQKMLTEMLSVTLNWMKLRWITSKTPSNLATGLSSLWVCFTVFFAHIADAAAQKQQRSIFFREKMLRFSVYIKFGIAFFIHANLKDPYYLHCLTSTIYIVRSWRTYNLLILFLIVIYLEWWLLWIVNLISHNPFFCGIWFAWTFIGWF